MDESLSAVPLWDVPSVVPILNVYGQVCEKYTDLGKLINQQKLLTGYEAFWPLAIRAIALPTSDKVFVERLTHSRVRVAALLGDKVLLYLRNKAES